MKYKIFPRADRGTQVYIKVGSSSNRPSRIPQEALAYADEQMMSRVEPLYRATNAEADFNKKFDLNNQLNRAVDDVQQDVARFWAGLEG